MLYSSVAGRSAPSPSEGEGGAPPTPTAKRNADESELSPPSQQLKANKQDIATKDKSNPKPRPFDLDYEKKENVEVVRGKLIELLSTLTDLTKKCEDSPYKDVFTHLQLCMSSQFDILTNLVEIASKNKQEKSQKDKQDKCSKIRNDLKNDLADAAFDVKIGPIEIDFNQGNYSKQVINALLTENKDLKDVIENKKIYVLSKKDEMKGKRECYAIIKTGSLDAKKTFINHLKAKNSKITTRYNFPSSVFPLVKRMRSSISKFNHNITVEGKEINLSKSDKFSFMIRPTNGYGALRISYSHVADKTNNFTYNWTKVHDFPLPESKEFDNINTESFLGIKN